MRTVLPWRGWRIPSCTPFHPGWTYAEVPSVPAQVLAELRTTPGVRGVAIVHQSPTAPGRHRLPGPRLGYWATVAGGLAASLAIIASTFPLLNRVTGPEAARND